MIRSAQDSTVVRRRPADVYALLKEYETWPEWLPDVESSRVLVRDGDVVVVELRGPSLGPGALVLETVETRDREIRFRQTDRYRRTGLSGSWSIGGSEDRAEVRLRLSLDVRPWQIGVRSTLRGFVTRSTQGFREHFEKAAPVTPRRLLAVVQCRGRIRVVLPDRTLELPTEGS